MPHEAIRIRIGIADPDRRSRVQPPLSACGRPTCRGG